MQESLNDKNTGIFSGQLLDNSFSGMWSSEDNKKNLNFELKIDNTNSIVPENIEIKNTTSEEKKEQIKENTTNLFDQIQNTSDKQPQPTSKIDTNNLPEKNQVSEVIAKGIATDNDKACKAALMNAVEQAVGLVVDAETLIKNEKIVKDQILTYSDGYVEKYDKIKEGKREDGLYETQIKATVKKRQLIEKLKQSDINVKTVDGQSIFAEVYTKQSAIKDIMDKKI